MARQLIFLLNCFSYPLLHLHHIFSRDRAQLFWKLNYTCLMAAQSEHPSEQLEIDEIKSSMTTDVYKMPEGEQTGSHGEDHDVGQFGYKPELEVI